MNRIGIDLGGTKIEGILTDENYKIITRKRIPTNQEEGYNSILESIKNLILELVQESNDNRFFWHSLTVYKYWFSWSKYQLISVDIQITL